MTETAVRTWSAKQTDETHMVVEVLNRAGFERADAYRYNSASIRVRVIDPRFESMPVDERYDLVEPALEQLPERTQGDIMSLYAFAPSEIDEGSPPSGKVALRQRLMNLEFEDHSDSML